MVPKGQRKTQKEMEEKDGSVKKEKDRGGGKREGNLACLTEDNSNIHSPSAQMHLYSALYQLSELLNKSMQKLLLDFSLQES